MLELSKLYIETWGCQMNEYDSQKMAELLRHSHGMSLTNKPEEAHVLLLNTCSIREKAQEKVFSQLGQWRFLKESGPARYIGVGGCVASQEGAALFKRAPYVDFVFGPQSLQQLPLMLNEVLSGNKHLTNIAFLPDEKFDQLPPPRAEGPTAFVTIQEGCSKFCKYCIVPFTRGPEVNRSFEDIFKEVEQLAEQQVREVTLLGQNVNAYQGVLPTGESLDLATLIFYIAEIPGIERIRFTTSHPVEFSDTLIDAYAHVPQLASHLHLPVQSGSNKILQAMGRCHTVEDYIDKIRALQKVRPGLSISSDFIVGYPGETEEDFQETLALVDAIEFDLSYSFIYSKRPGTLASSLECHLTEQEKKQRLYRLQERLNFYAQKHLNACVGTRQRVLVIRPSQSGDTLEGRLENNRLVHIKGVDATALGRFVQVQITEALAHSLRGQFIRFDDAYMDEQLQLLAENI
jgi:tRNA-2-methylthio-N6-dimethylallyladenosine synthase